MKAQVQRDEHTFEKLRDSTATLANMSGSRDYVGLTELDALGYVIVQKKTLRRKNRTQVSSLGR